MNEETAQERVRWAITLSLFALLLFALFQVMMPFMSAIAWAAVLVLTTWPAYRRLANRFPRHRALSALVMTLVVAAVVCVAVIPGVVLLVGELSQIRNTIDAHRAEFPHAQESSRLLSPEIARLKQSVAESLQPYLEQFGIRKAELTRLFGQITNEILTGVRSVATKFVGVIAQLVLCLLTAFFLYRSGDEIGQQLQRGLRRAGGERFERLLKAVVDTVRATVYGIFLTAVVQGVIAGIGFSLFGAPTPLLLSLLTMIISLLPFGAPLVYLPTVASMISGGQLWQGIALLLWGVGLVSTVDNLTRPLFISQATRVPLLLLFFAVMGGVMSFGLIGLFLGPVVVSVFHVLWREWVDERRYSTS